MRHVSRTQRLFILAEPRSGSSWLMETMNSRPEIRLLGEILNHVQNSGIKKYIGGHEKDFRGCLDHLERTLRAAANTKILFSITGIFLLVTAKCSNNKEFAHEDRFAEHV